MKPTGAQDYERGDIVALSFDARSGGALHRRDVQALRGVAFEDGDSERGISWSDMAMLLRSVKANGEPIMEALRRGRRAVRRHGHDNLFGTAEAEAARQLFYFIGRPAECRCSARLKAAWHSAALGYRRADAPARNRESPRRPRRRSTEPDQKRGG